MYSKLKGYNYICRTNMSLHMLFSIKINLDRSSVFNTHSLDIGEVKIQALYTLYD